MALASEGGTNRAVENSVSIVFLKDPTDAKWRNDAAVKLYRSIMSRFAKGANQKDVYHVYGMAVAYEFVKVLKAAGKNPTRASVMAQTRKLNDPSNPFLLPGSTVETSATERFPIEQALLQRWSKGSWKSFGGLWGYRAGIGSGHCSTRRSTTCSRRRAGGGAAAGSSPTRRRSSSR